ncbi:MAG: hypothetical protein ACWGPN_06350 [Gammaproteobacteria bacterium]
MDGSTAILSVVICTAVLAGFVFVACKLVTWARNRNTGAYVVGTLFGPFMALGNVVDPDFQIVNEAKRGRERKENDSGDPPADEDE